VIDLSNRPDLPTVRLVRLPSFGSAKKSNKKNLHGAAGHHIFPSSPLNAIRSLVPKPIFS